MAISATFSDFKLIKTRKVAQIILEVPIEQANNALSELGGVPQFESEQWVGVAPIKNQEHSPLTLPKPKSLAQMAGILCNDERFRDFLRSKGHLTKNANDAALTVRTICSVESRRELDTNPDAAMTFNALRTEFDVFTGRIAGPR